VLAACIAQGNLVPYGAALAYAGKIPVLLRAVNQGCRYQPSASSVQRI